MLSYLYRKALAGKLWHGYNVLDNNRFFVHDRPTLSSAHVTSRGNWSLQRVVCFGVAWSCAVICYLLITKVYGSSLKSGFARIPEGKHLWGTLAMTTQVLGTTPE